MESLKYGESTCLDTEQNISNSPTLPYKSGPTSRRQSILESQKLKDLKNEISIMKNRLKYIENVKSKTDKQILYTKKFMKKQKTAKEKKRAIEKMLSQTQNAIEDHIDKKKSQARAIKSDIQAKTKKSLQEIHRSKKLKVRKVRDEKRRSELQIKMQKEREIQLKKERVRKIRDQKQSQSKSIRNSSFLNKSTSKHRFKTAKEDFYSVYRKKEEMKKELEQLRNEECNKLVQLQSKLSQKQKVYAKAKTFN